MLRGFRLLAYAEARRLAENKVCKGLRPFGRDRGGCGMSARVLLSSR